MPKKKHHTDRIFIKKCVNEKKIQEKVNCSCYRWGKLSGKRRVTDPNGIGSLRPTKCSVSELIPTEINDQPDDGMDVAAWCMSKRLRSHRKYDWTENIISPAHDNGIGEGVWCKCGTQSS